MTDIPDFTEEELKIVQDSVNERYGHEIELQLADAEIRPDLSVRELIEVPAVFWAERDANFIIVKVGKNKYRSQFFYHGYQQFGTGHQMFDDIGLCVITTLQVQADHEAKEAKKTK
ncbi:MAG: hypothetical protein V3R65_03140 [Acidiferrobacterales bacterium]